MTEDQLDDQLDDMAHEIFAVAQLMPGECMLDGIARIIEVLKERGVHVPTRS